MKCPVCGVWTIVRETRNSDEYGVYRRRECANEHRFSTSEKVIPKELLHKKQIENFKKK